MTCVYHSNISDYLKIFGNNSNCFVNQMTSNFHQLTGSYPDQFQQNAWSGMFPHIHQLFSILKQRKLGGIHCIFEYQLPFSSERIDLVLIGEKNNQPIAIIVELKGWDNIQIKNDLIVLVNGEIHQHPELQLKGYLEKLRLTHSAFVNNNFQADGFLWLYNLNTQFKVNLTTFYSPGSKGSTYNDIANYITSLIYSAPNSNSVDNFLNGSYIQSKKLFDFIRNNIGNINQNLINSLCVSGFAPSEEQTKVLDEVLDSINNNQKVCFLIQGEPGSGKTYLAILLLLEIIRRYGNQNQNLVALGYRNNRLINTIRNIFRQNGSGLNNFIKFYSTGRGNGLAEGNPNNPHFKVVIYDEAQRMKKNNIKIAMQRGDITIFFYDEKQILNAEEEGYENNFIDCAKSLNIKYETRVLKGIHRIRGGEIYHQFVEDLLHNRIQGKINQFTNYELKIFDDFSAFICSLKQKTQNNKKVALVASFTESPGDRSNPTSYSMLNKRVGYPLCSGFDHYININLVIYWLMDEKNQYPQFWAGCQSNQLTHCASIYGCQGFEADYVGVIWGRDFVYRNGKWELGDNCEDTIGNPSLKDLFKKSKTNQKAYSKAMELLINRYRIFLTRGILGTYIYCEDEETRNYLKGIIP